MTENPAGQERTEAATARRRRSARERGDIARSVEVGSVAVLAGALVGFAVFGSDMVRAIVEVFRTHFAELSAAEVTRGTAVPYARRIAASLAAVLLPWSATVFLVGAGASLAQTGAVFTWKPVAPQLRRVSPAAGLRRIFSRRSAGELGKSLLKLTIVGGLVSWTLWGRVESLLPLAVTGLGAGSRTIVVAMLEVAVVGTLALGAVAILDFGLQRWHWDKRIKMTRQEAKDDRRQSEGDPLAKSRVQTRRQEMARRGSAQNVATADVVVVDPTHVAVALAYDPGRMPAPRVVARGARLLARQIHAVATEAGVPIVEDSRLARALYRDAGAEIPTSQYASIAELLAGVFHARETPIAAGVR